MFPPHGKTIGLLWTDFSQKPNLESWPRICPRYQPSRENSVGLFIWVNNSGNMPQIVHPIKCLSANFNSNLSQNACFLPISANFSRNIFCGATATPQNAPPHRLIVKCIRTRCLVEILYNPTKSYN